MFRRDVVTIRDAFGRERYTGTFVRTYVRVGGVFTLVDVERLGS